MTDIQSPAQILITGIMASGKSTIAQALAERLPKSVHLRGDVFRRMIVNGRAAMESPLSDAALGQLRLRYQLAAHAANGYCEAGFTVVYQDIIIGDLLNEVVAMRRGWPLYVVVLCPAASVVFERDAHRHKQTYQSWTPEGLDQALRDETPHIGLWLDTSALTIEQTVEAIFNQLDTARI
ncbi:MAG: AAA family ATPase [Chloroflexi bacterium]|nr:AAA family ATPase [Chloroflexota bacterium]MCC6894995.1 AAA family ATPase [Anaerolineae bacterium]